MWGFPLLIPYLVQIWGYGFVEKFNSRVETPNKREEIRGSILLLTEVQNILLGRLSGTRENNKWGFPGSRKPQNNYSSLLFIKKK